MVAKLSNYHCFAYALPVVGTSCLMAPLGVLQGIYAKYYGLPLTVIATVLLITRMFDAISDPLIGYCADRYHQSKGSYKPFILIGGMLFIMSSYFLYLPPVQVDVIYFTIWLLLFYFSWTLFEMPHLAWPTSIAQKSEEKTRIYTFRNMGNYAGWLLFYTVPLLPIFDSSSITPETLEILVLGVSALAIPSFILCLNTRFLNISVSSAMIDRPIKSSIQRRNLRSFILSLLNNKPIVFFICAYSLISISTGMWYGLIFLYVDVYLEMGEYYAKVFLIAFIIGFLVNPLWYKLSMRWGKKLTWTLGTLFLIVSFAYTGLLRPDHTSVANLAILKTVQTLGFTCMGVVAPAMLSEIIDYSNWRYRSDNSAIYFSIYAFISKTTIALAMSLGLALAGWYGFNATASIHSDHSIFGLTLAIAWLPPLFAALALIFILLSPIDERRHKIIRRSLDKKVIQLAYSLEEMRKI